VTTFLDRPGGTDAGAPEVAAPTARLRLRPAARTGLRRPDEPAQRARRAPPWAVPGAPAQPAGRLASVDALRGFSMIWILGGDGLARSLAAMAQERGPLLSAVGQFVERQFEHPQWEGFTFYDLIFPLFLFVTGVAIVLSLTRLVAREGRARAHARVMRRSLLLFLLGVLFYGGLRELWPDIRLLGVLQRIALCYLFASLLFLNLNVGGMAVAFASLLLGYWALLTLVPVPELGAPSLAEGATLANWVDRHYLPGLKWFGSWDPEGLLSTLPAVASCLLGVFAGLLLIDARLDPARKSRWLVGAGAAMIVAGHLWGLQFPIVKNIWTSSYVLVAGGWSALLLGVFHQLADVWGRRVWATAFVWIGASAIVLYLLNNVIDFSRLARRFVGGDVARFADERIGEGAGGFLAYAVAVAMVIALARFLHRRKIFLRV
jgi:predicted acyltransferase